MSKKLLIGSIIAIIIIVGVSFTSVVGYNGVESNLKASPLFNIRTNRAIDEESHDLTYDYVGKGEEIDIPIPKRNITIELISKAIKIISKMDKNELKKLIDLIKVNYNNINNGKFILNKDIDILKDENQQLIAGNGPFTDSQDATLCFLGYNDQDLCVYAIVTFSILGIPLIIAGILFPFIMIPLAIIVIILSFIFSCHGQFWTIGP